MSTIRRVWALEILDSRGRPTVQATCELESGASATVLGPVRASTGAAEALELRDGDPRRYGGLGCRTAVANVNGPIDAAVRAAERSATQADLDRGLDRARRHAEQVPARRQRDPGGLARLRARRRRRGGIPLYRALRRT